LYHPVMPVELTPAAAQQLAKLPRVIRSRVTKLLGRLEEWPAVSGAKPLKGRLAGKFRIRTGDYRLQFHLVGSSVVVERIGHRDGFYDK
jgi:mRNA-degrading endonuclease RelE of RelBE toxin-antitoxin system